MGAAHLCPFEGHADHAKDALGEGLGQLLQDGPAGNVREGIVFL